MNLAGLSLQNAPGFRVPMRYFLSVPVFGIIAGLVVLLDGGELFQSRWQPGSLAVTHALVLGYIGMAMLGALFQMLPVVIGAAFPMAERAAMPAHLVFACGALCLVIAFLTQWTSLFAVAAILLVPVLILFGAGVLLTLQRAGNKGTVSHAVRLAVLALIVTVAIGGYLAAGYAFDSVRLQRAITDYHAAWGLAGWIAVLVIGISAQVIPMFLATPSYPRAFSKTMVYLLISVLIAASLLPSTGFEQVSMTGVAILMAAYAAVTLYLLQQRRRKRFDVTDWFWRTGMVCLIAGSGMLVYSGPGDLPAGTDPQVVAGTLLLAGFAVSLVNGMLYKIVPFLVWLNLRMPVLKGQVPAGTRLYTPNIHEVIGLSPMKLQLSLHLLGVVLLVVAAFDAKPWVYPAAAMVLASNIMLLVNLLRAVWIYHEYSNQTITGERDTG